MPGTSKSRNPQGYEIAFDEATHTYTSSLYAQYDPNSNPVSYAKTSPVKTAECPHCVYVTTYTSGTKFVHHFFPTFDPDGKIAERKAQERGVTADAIRAEWKAKADEACAMGTRVHETCEDILQDRRDLFGKYDFRNQPQSDRERAIMSSAFRAATHIKQNFEILGIEQIVFDFRLELAGTIDLLARDKDGCIWILDWKTNSHIDFDNYFGQHALAPIEHLPDCNAVHYGLQLSTYQYLLVQAGYLSRKQAFKRAIIHLGMDAPHIYELPDYSVEVRDMVISYLSAPPF